MVSFSYSYSGKNIPLLLWSMKSFYVFDDKHDNLRYSNFYWEASLRFPSLKFLFFLFLGKKAFGIFESEIKPDWLWPVFKML